LKLIDDLLRPHFPQSNNGVAPPRPAAPPPHNLRGSLFHSRFHRPHFRQGLGGAEAVPAQ
jgi:hypothetical protein